MGFGIILVRVGLRGVGSVECREGTTEGVKYRGSIALGSCQQTYFFSSVALNTTDMTYFDDGIQMPQQNVPDKINI